MTKPFAPSFILFLLVASLAVGWRGPSASPPKGLVSPINMTLADKTLFVSDETSGVHVYDVTDASVPRKLTRIGISGNRGTAVKGDVLYASSWNSVRVYQRAGETFTFVLELESEYGYDMGGWEGSDDYSFACTCGTSNDLSGAPVPANGGSSYATFAVIDDYLYHVDRSTLVVYDIQKPAEPKEVGSVRVDWSIETIYPTPEYLFIGGTRGMYVCDRTNPAEPELIGRLEHFRACDPVVVSGETAYVTLRGGNRCGETRDLLLAVDISDPANPSIASEKVLATPYGLAVREPYLYVSTGASGYSLFDVRSPAEPSSLAAWSNWPTKDFLWSSNLLFVLGFDDLRIFDVSDPKSPALLSVIESDPS